MQNPSPPADFGIFGLLCFCFNKTQQSGLLPPIEVNGRKTICPEYLHREPCLCKAFQNRVWIRHLSSRLRSAYYLKSKRLLLNNGTERKILRDWAFLPNTHHITSLCAEYQCCKRGGCCSHTHHTLTTHPPLLVSASAMTHCRAILINDYLCCRILMYKNYHSKRMLRKRLKQVLRLVIQKRKASSYVFSKRIMQKNEGECGGCCANTHHA